MKDDATITTQLETSGNSFEWLIEKSRLRTFKFPRAKPDNSLHFLCSAASIARRLDQPALKKKAYQVNPKHPDSKEKSLPSKSETSRAMKRSFFHCSEKKESLIEANANFLPQNERVRK